MSDEVTFGEVLNDFIRSQKVEPVEIRSKQLENIKYTCSVCNRLYTKSALYEDYGVCDRCASRTVVGLFNRDNDNLTIKEFKEKIRNEVI